MSAPLGCPACRAPIRPAARYCVQCGLEVRQPCPACGEAPRLLSLLAPGASAWCAVCEALLDRCESCGRWLTPAARLCPDPECGGRVLPLHPQHTGRRWDARGDTAGWRYPAEWDRAHPAHRAPAVEAWTAAEELHAAFVAHGRLYAWDGRILLAAPSGTEAAPEWRCALGPAGIPAPLPFPERLAVVGARAVAAMERSFVQVDLRHAGHVWAMPGGPPLAQAGGPGWWVGWSSEAGDPVLRIAPAGDAGHALEPRAVALPPGAPLAAGGRVALRDGVACWPGRDGSVWRVDCAASRVEPATAPQEGSLWVWAEADGPRAAAETSRQITVGLTAPAQRRFGINAPAGAGPLRGVFAGSGQVVVVAARIAAFDARLGDRVAECVRPPGLWVDGALAPASDGEPRLIAVTVEEPFAVVSAVRLASGSQDTLWREAGPQPRGLLAAGEQLYVAHRRGVVRLSQ